jgi:putative transposase
MREEEENRKEVRIPMPKQARAIHPSEKEQEELRHLIRRHRSEQQVVLRARIILAAAQGASNARIARKLGINVDTVRLWRDRWANQQEADHELMDQGAVNLVQRLQDAPRPGAVPKFTVEQRAQMAALACEAPRVAERSISQWTGREIADELKTCGIVTEISPRHAARLLKKGASSPTGFATG